MESSFIFISFLYIYIYIYIQNKLMKWDDPQGITIQVNSIIISINLIEREVTYQLHCVL